MGKTELELARLQLMFEGYNILALDDLKLGVMDLAHRSISGAYMCAVPSTQEDEGNSGQHAGEGGHPAIHYML